MVYRLRGKVGTARRATLTLAYPGDKSYAPKTIIKTLNKPRPLNPTRCALPCASAW